MSRKIVFTLVFLLLLAVILVNFDLPALAASQGQEGNPPERLRPDQYSYHGNEEIPFLPSPNPPELDSETILSPVEQWSKMTFESYVNDNWEIYYASGSFTNLVRLTNNDSFDIHPLLNRGCTRIVFASDRDGTDYELYSMKTDGSSLVRLTNNTTDDVKPAWSPDGTRIAFQTYRDGNAEVYVMNADGSGLTNLTHSADYDGEPAWSPDGNHIAFTSYRNLQWRIWVMHTDGSNPVQLSSQPYSELPVWSPDGSMIVYDADADYDDMMELWVMNSDGSSQAMKVDLGYGYTVWANGWSPDQYYMTYTVVHLFYYYGDWYWDYAYLYGLSQNGYTDPINPGRMDDWNLDWTTSDKQPPSTNMSTPPSPAPYQFTVSWSGQDNVSGIKSYDLQVRDGTGGAWTDWQMGTTDTSAIYTGVGGHGYYFRIRGRDNAFNLQSWPANYSSYTWVENFPPMTRIDQLPPYSRGDNLVVSWGGHDLGGSGIQSYDLQFMDSSIGNWQDWLLGVTVTNTIFIGELGHTYSFRSRGVDNALNIEAWPGGNGDAITTFYSWLATGTARDNTGAPVSGMDISIDPQAFLTYPSNVDGRYSAYLASDPEIKTIIWSKSEYGALPATDYGYADANVDIYLPPIDNAIQDFGFESGALPGAWQTGGDFTPILTNSLYHSGDYAALLGTSPSLSTQDVFTTTNYSVSPVLITDRLAGVHIAWTEGHVNDPYNFYYTHRLPYGAWLPTEMIYESWSSDVDIGMVVDDDLNVHMLLEANYELIYLVRDSGGNWSIPQVLFTSAQFLGMKIDDSSTIHALLFYGGVLTYARHEDGGEWEVESVPDTEPFIATTFAIDSQGEFHLAWRSFYTANAYYLLRHADGSWTNPVIFTRPGGITSLNMVVDSTDLPHIILTENYPTYQLAYTAAKPDGNWITPYVISASGSYPKLMIDHQDTLYALWADDTGSQEIYYTQKKAHENWSWPQNISHTSTRSVGVEGAISAGGDVYAAWQEIDNTTLFYSWMQAGVWSTPIQLSGGSYAWWPKVEVDSMGGVNFGWIQRITNPGFYYVSTLPLNQSGDSRLSQSLTIPISMTNPTLSFLATLSGVSDISGNEFRLQVTTDISNTTTIYTSTTPANWEHFWFDMTPWSGQEITLTFQVTENAGYPPASALLDEVTLGAAHPDVWVDLTSASWYAHPGEQFSFQLDYGNHGGPLAASTAVTLTLPAGLNFVEASPPPTTIVGDQLIWQVGDILGKSGPNTITLTVEVDAAALLGQTVLTGVEISTSSPELEMLNNTSQVETYLGYIGILPIIRR